MKIEIDLKELDSLREQVTMQKERIEKLETELKALDSKMLKEQAVELSKKLFDNYMECVFRHLGFTDKCGVLPGSVIFEEDLGPWLGQAWWNSPRLKIQIGASVSEQFRAAFLKLGIKPDLEEDKGNNIATVPISPRSGETH